MRWFNNYHRGFNRLLLVFSIVLSLAFVGLNALMGRYEPRVAKVKVEATNLGYSTPLYRRQTDPNRFRYLPPDSSRNNTRWEENTIRKRVGQLWREKEDISPTRQGSITDGGVNEGTEGLGKLKGISTPDANRQIISEDTLKSFFDKHGVPNLSTPDNNKVELEGLSQLGAGEKDEQTQIAKTSEFEESTEELAKRRILTDVRSMKEAKVFTMDRLKTIIHDELEYQKAYQQAEREYPQRVWKARGRFATDLLGAFIVTFAIGHGVFLVVWWIIRGFR